MKKLLTLMIVLLFVVSAKADYLGPLTTSQYVQCEAFSFDSVGVDPIKPESLFIVVYDPDGDSTFGEIIDTSNANVKGPYTRRIGNGATEIFYNWFRLVSAIDGDQGVGPYQISVLVYEDADETRWITNHHFTLVDTSINNAFSAAGKTFPEIENIDAWNPITDNDSLINDRSANFVGLNDRAITLAKFDTAAVAAYYNFGIWIDEASANTDSDVGVDGTTANPVSTFAAARILADSMGLQKYYLINGTSLTLAATHISWEFIGIGGSCEVNFGSQDVDSSYFENVMIAGTQGGTGMVFLHRCYMDAADSLECVATNSWFSDTISVRVAPNIIFDQCYSAVPGNATPGIDFNSAGGTIGVNMRHYSGGLALLNMDATHTISYEADGQLVIDTSSTSANVTARGNMDITDNGVTTALTQNAVFNQTITQTTLDVVNGIVLTGTNIATIAEADSLTDGIETNTYTSTQIHDGVYYQIAESDGVVGTNLNINTFLQFDIGPDAKPFALIHLGRLDEGSAPSGGDTLHIWVYDWSGGGSWTHINPPGGDFVGVFNSSSADDVTFEVQLIDPNFVSDDSGKVRIAYSNYDPDGATANDLEEDTEFYLDFAFIEYQMILSATTIADVVNDSIFFADTSAYNDVADSYGQILAKPTYVQADVSALATATNLAIAIDSINAILDTVQNQSTWIATAANLTIAIDSINAILDSLQSQDDWVATFANQTLIIDTVNGIIDTMQLWSDEINLINTIRDSLFAVLDSIQINLDGKISEITATLPDSSAGDISYIANNQDDFKADVSGCGAGPSVANDTLFVYDATDTTILIGVKVTVRPSGGGEAVATALTNPAGRVIFGLEDGTYDYLLFQQGVNFNAVDTVAISGTGTDSLFGTPFSPSAGPANTTAIFTWLITQAQDTLDASEVKWMLVSNANGREFDDSDWITSGTGTNKVVHDKGWHTVSSDTALISFNLVPNTDIFVNGVQDTSSYVKFKADYNGNITVRTVQVPDTTSFNPYAP